MRRQSIVFITMLLVAAAPRPAAAWGFEAHKFIVERAIALLPPELRPFFEKNATYLVEHAIDPDLWRTAGWEAESPRHFVDMDAFGPYPFTGLPHDYAQAVAKFGRDMVEKNGLLPWRSEEIYRKLVEAFTQKTGYSRENIKFFSAVLGHYAADAHVPFHAALNHDGQLTGQWGLHARFESELFDRTRSQLHLTPGPIRPVPNAREFIFETLTTSFTFVQTILDADKAAVAGREEYDEAYFNAFAGKVKPILEKRVSDSITGVASLIVAAWVEAGRPAVPVDAPPAPPRKVRKG
jgi:Zinc dependent phospholipase C